MVEGTPSPTVGDASVRRSTTHSQAANHRPPRLVDVVAGLGLGHAVVDDVGRVDVAIAVGRRLGGDRRRRRPAGAVDVLGLGELLLGELGQAADGVALVDA